MTSKELNREFRKLMRAYTAMYSLPQKQFYSTQMVLKKTLLDLYRASDQFKYANARSVLTFIYLNNSLRAAPFHHVYVNQELLS